MKILQNSNSPGQAWTFAAFAGGFLCLIAFFAIGDVYNLHFDDRGYAAAYNGARVIFAAYYFWIIYVCGRWIVTLRLRDLPIKAVDRVVMSFFIGAAVLTLAMLVLGYLGLLRRTVAIPLAIAIVVLSYNPFHELLSGLSSGRTTRALGLRPARPMIAIAAMATIVAASLLLLIKGLYPQGGHDYYQHYSHYYMDVVTSHNVWPNDFWYHYFYSKGMGLMFWAMLLTDALAPSIVTFCFVVAAALALYSLVEDFDDQGAWGWCALLLYFALNVHTLGTGFYAANGGWGHFQKPHEINGPVIFAILWAATKIVRSSGPTRVLWWQCAAVLCVFVAYLLIISSAIVGLFCVLSVAAFLRWDRAISAAFFKLAVVAGLGLGSILALNYVTTGIPSDIALGLWWPIVDFGRLNEWGALFDAVNTAFRRDHLVEGALSPFRREIVEFTANVLRANILGPLLASVPLAAAATIWLAVRRGKGRSPLPAATIANVSAYVVILAFVAAVLAFAFTLALGEAVSFVRITSFMLPVMIAWSCATWQLLVTSGTWSRATGWCVRLGVPVGLGLATLLQAYEGQKSTLPQVLSNALRFAGGWYSIYDAYRDQSGWPALPGSTAIYPGIHEAWKAVGPGVRIWSFNVHSYCMVPGCRVESHLSSRLDKDRAVILSGAADDARAAFQRAGLNYFFISTRLDVRDVLVCTPLFAPETIASHLGIKWADGPDVLLTWKGPGIQPIPAQWIESYRAAILRAGRHGPGCDDGGPPFTSFGLRVLEDVNRGLRWGAQIRKPW